MSAWYSNILLSQSFTPAFALQFHVIMNHVTIRVEVMLVGMPGLFVICHPRGLPKSWLRMNLPWCVALVGPGILVRKVLALFCDSLRHTYDR